MTGTCNPGDGNVSYTFSSPSGGTNVTGSVACSAGSWTTGSISMTTLNENAAITFDADQTDSNGNTGSATQLTALKDVVLPVVAINAVSTINNANEASYTVTGTCTNGDGNVSYVFSSPSGGTDKTGSVACSAGSWTTGSISMASLNDDVAITFNADQSDSAANTGSATELSAIKDSADPVVAINAVSTINSANKILLLRFII